MRTPLMRYDPDARLLQRLRDRMDDLFEDFLGEFPRWGVNPLLPRRAHPPVNLWEDETNLYAECEIPGIAMDDLELTVVDNELRIKGEWKGDAVESATVHREERPTGQFTRVIRLPVEIDSDKVSAELVNGVLTITLPKSTEALPRKIAVKRIGD